MLQYNQDVRLYVYPGKMSSWELLYFTFMWYADLISEACNDKQVSYNVAMVIVSYT